MMIPKKVTTTIALTFVLMLAEIIGVQGQAQTVPWQDLYEPNDTWDEAYGPLTSGAIYEGELPDLVDRDWFYVDVLSDGVFEVTLTESEPNKKRLELCLYSDKIQQIDCVSTWTGVHYIRQVNLPTGRFYIVVRPGIYDQEPDHPYRLQAFVPGHEHHPPNPISDTAFEPNDAYAIAYGSIQTGVTYEGYISTRYDHDWFFANVEQDGILDVSLTEPRNVEAMLCVYNREGRLLKCQDHWSGVHRIILNNLESDRYYFLAWSPNNADHSSDPYKLVANFTSPQPTPTPTPTPYYQYLPLIWRLFDVNATATPTNTPTTTPTATPTKTITPTPTHTPTPFVKDILRDGFEDDFPGPWKIYNDSSLVNSVWGKTSCRRFSGKYSIWAGVGDGIPCATDYPNNTDTWIIFGPFDLSDASTAQVNFKYRLKSELDYDTFLFGASIDGTWFYGKEGSGGTDTWKDYTFDLSDVFVLGSLLGEEQVWFGFHFESDSSINYSGVFVDEVVIRKRVGGVMASVGNQIETRSIGSEFKDAVILLPDDADQ